MAAAQLICELPGDTYPQASTGYGKRSVPGEHCDADTQFTHLPAREAGIAGYLDRLPEGADISVKTLARMTPYGQCALRTALRRLSAAGHLRRVRETIQSDDGSYHHVTRTYFSRTAREDAWWEAYVHGETPVASRPPTERPRAYRLLASLGRRDARLQIGARDCAVLEPLAGAWLARGADEADVVRALTTGLPPVVHHPAALLRRRLTDKLPPHPPSAPASPRGGVRMECTACDAPAAPGGPPRWAVCHLP